MDMPMLDPVTKTFTDRSTMKAFSFSFFCDKCGREWRSTPQAFVPGALATPVNLQVIRMLWNAQHRAAYERANLEALYAFTLCPACARRLCSACFYASETESDTHCNDCLEKTPRNHAER